MVDNVFNGIEKEEIKLPLDILSEYEKQFSQAFGQTLLFQIVNREEESKEDWMKLDPFVLLREPAEKKFVTRAYVVAPALNNYRMLVLKISYLRSKVYPCDFFNAFDEKTAKCDDSEALDNAMKSLFFSEEFKKPIRMLLSQIG